MQWNLRFGFSKLYDDSNDVPYPIKYKLFDFFSVLIIFVLFFTFLKLNQDLLENLISQIRTNGGLNDRQTPLSVIYRLRLIILGKHIGISQQNVNTEEYSEEHDAKDDFLTAKMFRRAEIDPEIPRPEDECIEDRSASHREDHGIK